MAIYYLYILLCRRQHKVDGKRAFFCTRRKKFLYAYKIYFLRDADNFFSSHIQFWALS